MKYLAGEVIVNGYRVLQLNWRVENLMFGLKYLSPLPSYIKFLKCKYFKAISEEIKLILRSEIFLTEDEIGNL